MYARGELLDCSGWPNANSFILLPPPPIPTQSCFSMLLFIACPLVIQSQVDAWDCSPTATILPYHHCDTHFTHLSDAKMFSPRFSQFPSVGHFMWDFFHQPGESNKQLIITSTEQEQNVEEITPSPEYVKLEMDRPREQRSYRTLGRERRCHTRSECGSYYPLTSTVLLGTIFIAGWFERICELVIVPDITMCVLDLRRVSFRTFKQKDKLPP